MKEEKRKIPATILFVAGILYIVLGKRLLTSACRNHTERVHQAALQYG